MDCILRALKTNTSASKGCAVCSEYCQYRISLHGINGDGGRLQAAGIPLEHRNALVSDIPVRSDQPKLYRQLDKYVESFVKIFEHRPGVSQFVKNIYLYSEKPGTGKTATACALANEYMARHYVGHLQRGQTPPDNAVFFMDCAEFYQLYTQITRPGIPKEISERAARRYYEIMERASKSEFVIMDDIGIRAESDAFRMDLHKIINTRYNKKLPTVYTSNVKMAELRDIFDARLYDRVADLTYEYTMLGDSHRSAKRK